MRSEPDAGGGVTAALEAFPRAGDAPIAGIDASGRLYPIDKMRAHREGALHLAVSVFVLCGDALLVQRRAAGKYHCAGMWANTCCTHPQWDEAPADAAARRLVEELGVKLPLKATGVIEYAADVTDGLREHERVHVFRGEAAQEDIELNPDPAEVAAVAWIDVGELKRRAGRTPRCYAPWFRIYLERWDELGL
jgi:isopentenyl-diphosphate delta-isomerase